MRVVGRRGPRGRGFAVGLEEGEEVGFRQVEAEGFEGDFKFVEVDASVFVDVEEGKLRGEENFD